MSDLQLLGSEVSPLASLSGSCAIGVISLGVVIFGVVLVTRRVLAGTAAVRTGGLVGMS